MGAATLISPISILDGEQDPDVSAIHSRSNSRKRASQRRHFAGGAGIARETAQELALTSRFIARILQADSHPIEGGLIVSSAIRRTFAAPFLRTLESDLNYERGWRWTATAVCA